MDVSSQQPPLTYQLAAPEPFTFVPEHWTTWKRRWERFRTASGLHAKNAAEQVNSFVYLMGPKAEEIFATLPIPAGKKESYADVVAAFEGFFIVKKNVVYERAVFNSRSQLEGEPAADFITALYALVETCEYGNLKDELLRDRIVVGVRDKKLSTKLQMESDLTLERAVLLTKQTETVGRQQENLKHSANAAPAQTVHVDRLQAKSKQTKKIQAKAVSSSTEEHSKATQSCYWCGKPGKHPRPQCPAAKARCNKCGKPGHFASVCKAKRLRQVVQQPQGTQNEDEVFFAGAITTAQKKMPWKVSVLVNDQDVTFRLDTGADVTVVPTNLLSILKIESTLVKPDMVILGPARQRLDVVGTLHATVAFQGKRVEANLYVTKGLDEPLLGLDLIESLDILRQVNGAYVGPLLDPVDEYPELFQGLGQTLYECKIRLKSEIEPITVTSPRRIPVPLLKAVENQLLKMESEGVITRVDEPTDWCSPIVVVPKKNGDVRICVDYTNLNKCVQREYHPIPSVEPLLATLGQAQYFSRLDAYSGFYQFNRLPFGISCAPEHFQRMIHQLTGGLDGIVCHIDDILVWGKTREEHDNRLHEVLKRLKEKGLTLNRKKCVFAQETITFLGHVINRDGVTPDQSKIAAIVDMPAPTNVTELKRFLGMVNFIARFIPNLAAKTAPLRELLRKDVSFTWDCAQQHAFEEVKNWLMSPPVLALYCPMKATILSADASSYGLGAVLMQRQEDKSLRVVAYASKSLTEAEGGYSQIEKEALAVTWACEKFKDYVVGLKFHIETDHKPLISLFTRKPVDDLTPRLQRLRLRMMRFDYTMQHVPGKDLVVADTLSRQPLPEQENAHLAEEVAEFEEALIRHVRVPDVSHQRLLQAQNQDAVCKTLRTYLQTTWPDTKSQVCEDCLPYWQFRNELTLHEGILMRGQRFLIPAALRPSVLSSLHDGHEGIVKCKRRAKESCWWPGISHDIVDMVEKCVSCMKQRLPRSQPLISTPFPDRPWQRVAMDLFYANGKNYLLVTDYYSRYIEIALLENQRPETVILKSKSIFARHGIPETVVTDNGPQFRSEFTIFAKDWGFAHTTSSPKYPQSNGCAEAAVKIAKAKISKSSDPYRALLAYRATPLANGFSPAELLFNRRLRTHVPIAAELLLPSVPDADQLSAFEGERRKRQEINFNRRHSVREREEFQPQQKVWVTDLKRHGTILSVADTPRSYWVITDQGTVRRNAKHLVLDHRGSSIDDDQLSVSSLPCVSRPSPFDGTTPQTVTEASGPTSRYGRHLKPPTRYGYGQS
ncbi:uncharacterized protein K02A2.6-like [Ornithodoros turicata]|uniref:uncharacterized protein K02A2.6-like n=1 Tax=Ornithodoros turicata TaxID=34597 RepID=UPI003138BB87